MPEFTYNVSLVLYEGAVGTTVEEQSGLTYEAACKRAADYRGLANNHGTCGKRQERIEEVEGRNSLIHYSWEFTRGGTPTATVRLDERYAEEAR